MAPAAEKKGAEHRRDERRSFSGSIPIVTELGGEEVLARAVDLSCGGCFLIASVMFQVGEVIVLSVPVLGKEPMRVFGQVCHRRPAKGGFGYGIMFVDLSEDERVALRETCSSLPPPVPKPPPKPLPKTRRSRPPAGPKSALPPGPGRRTN